MRTICIFWKLSTWLHSLQVFSHFVACFFILFMVSFAVEKLVNLLGPILIFVFISVALGD